MSRRLLVLAVLCALCIGHCVLYLDATIDDAYIGYCYAQSIAQGHGVVFDPGEYVEGFTHLTWVLLAALVMVLGAPDPHPVMQVIGIACSCGTVVVLYLLAERVLARRGPLWAALPPLLLLSRASFAYYTCAGLETPLLLLLFALILHRISAQGLGLGVGLLLGVAEWTRPETPYFAALFVAFAWAQGRWVPGAPAFRGAALLHLGLGFGALWGARVAFRLIYYGHLLPNTYHAKAMSWSEGMADGWTYTLGYLAEVHYVPVAALLLLVLPGRDRRFLLVAALWLASLLPIFRFGGDWMYLWRFFTHVLPFEVLLITGGVVNAARLLAPRGVRIEAAAATALLMVALLGAGRRSAHHVETIVSTYPGFYARARELGHWIGAQPTVHRVATVDIGVLGFVSDKDIVDLGGLTDEVIARAPGRLLRKQYDATYVLDLQPELVVLRSNGPGLRPIGDRLQLTVEALPASDRPLFAHPRFGREYEYVFSAPVGVDRLPNGQEVVRYAYHVYRRRGVELSPPAVPQPAVRQPAVRHSRGR